MEMAASDVDRLWLAIDVLEAQESLLKIKTDDIQNMKQGPSNTERSQIYNKAYPSRIYKRKSITLEEAVKGGLKLGG